MSNLQSNHKKHSRVLPHERSRIPLIEVLSHTDKSIAAMAKKALSACSTCPSQFFRQIKAPKPIRNQSKV